MEYQKCLLDFKNFKNLLNKASDTKFVTRKWNIVNDQSNANYSVGNEIICSTEVPKYSFCDYNYACILLRGDITITGRNLAIGVSLKNCAPFVNCFTKTDGTTTNGAEDLDLVMPMYTLLEYSLNYSDTTGSLWFCSKDEAVNFNGNFVGHEWF